MLVLIIFFFVRKVASFLLNTNPYNFFDKWNITKKVFLWINVKKESMTTNGWTIFSSLVVQNIRFGKRFKFLHLSHFDLAVEIFNVFKFFVQKSNSNEYLKFRTQKAGSLDTCNVLTRRDLFNTVLIKNNCSKINPKPKQTILYFYKFVQ